MASKLSDIFLGLNPSMKIGGQSTVATLSPSAVPFTPVNRNLPLGGGSYSSPVVAQPQTPVPPKAPATVMPQAGVQSPTQPTGGVSYDKYRNPVTGAIMSPQEYADYIAKRVSGGSIPSYAGDAITGAGMGTEAELATRARELNNERNDIATGTTDPYSVASKSGIAYSPAELAAIEKAYAGIYDPALNDVFAKLDKKEKEAAAERENKAKLEQMAQQHKYDLELKRTPTAADIANQAAIESGTGGYVEGQNPIVDSWVQRISRGEAKLSDITGVKNQGLKNLVNMGLNTLKARNATSSGNLSVVNSINNLLANPDLENISGFLGQTGVTSLFGKAKTAKTEYNQIIGNLQLAAAKLLQGQGQVSNFERDILANASAAIDRGQNDKEFQNALVKIRGVMMTSSGLEAPVRVISPTGEVVESTADTEEINELISEGNRVEYIK